MRLITHNAQGEMGPLAIGIHALKRVPLAPGKDGGGLASYAKRIGKSAPRVTELRHAAEVAHLFGQPKRLENYVTHLVEIHRLRRRSGKIFAIG
jgi:hypothetical protein